MIKKIALLFFVFSNCFVLFSQEESRIIGNIGKGESKKPIYFEDLSFNIYTESQLYYQQGRSPLTGSLLDVITWKVFEIEYQSRNLEFESIDVELDNYLFGDQARAKAFSYYSEVFGSKIVKDLTRSKLITRKMQEILRSELLEINGKNPTEQDLLDFYVQYQKDAFTVPTSYRLGMIELQNSSESEEVEEKLLSGESFEDVASAHSEHFDSARNGGNLGQDMTESAIKSQLSFAASEILEAEEGSWIGPIPVSASLGQDFFYFFKILNLEQGYEQSFEDVRQTILDELTYIEAEPLLMDWVIERLLFHGVQFEYALYDEIYKEALPQAASASGQTEMLNFEGE